MTTLRQASDPVGPAEVEEALARVLAAEPFVNAPSLAAFLSFIVRETLAGRDDRLKAYTIAVGALDRSPDFDPNENPLVRVQARRLRAALDRYHLTEGRDAPLRIELPIGSYVPVFVERTPEPAAPSPGSRESGADAVALATRFRPPLRRRALVGLVVVCAVVGAIGGWYAGSRFFGWPPTARGPTTGETGETRPSGESDLGTNIGLDATRVLPLLAVTVETGSPAPPEFDAEVYRSRIEDYARRFDDAIVVTRRSAEFPPPVGQPLYRLRALAVREGGNNNVYFQLVHAGDERLVDSLAVVLDAIRGPTYTTFEPPPDLAFVRGTVRVHGTISQDLARGPDIGPELTCLTKAWNYYLESSRQTHNEARDCLIPIVAANPRLVPALTMLGEIHIGEYRQNLDRSIADPLARAEELLNRASRLAPGSSAVYRVLENLLLIRGDADAALRAAARAVRNNPDDADAVGGFGGVLARLCRYDEAVHYLLRAEASSPIPPKWMQFYAFLALNNLGRTQEADDQVAFFEGTTSSLFLAAAAIRFDRRGDKVAAARVIAAIHEYEPTLTADPKSFLRRRGFADAVSDRLLRDLAAAGLFRSPD